MARGVAAKEVVELPEADALEDFPHPRLTDKLFGHAGAEKTFRDAFEGSRVHHAWLLCGAKGIGKATLAYRIANWALAKPDARAPVRDGLDVAVDSRTAGQIRSLSHPGLLLIRRPYDVKAKRFTASIPVDEVRRLRSFLSHKADADAWRVVILDSADELNVNAANALLKSLEEPPARAIFLLIASEPGRLLPTIRSRCRRLALAPLPSDPLRRAALQALEAAEMGHQDAGLAQLEPFAGGSVRRLLTLKAGGGDKLFEQAQAILSALPQVDWPRVHGLADELGSVAAAQRFETFFELLFEILHRAIRAGAAGAAAAGGPGDTTLAMRLLGTQSGDSAAPSRLASWAQLWETMQLLKAECLELNLDRKALILDCVSRMQQLARSQR